MNATQNPNSDQWDVCPPGLLQETAQKGNPGDSFGTWIGAIVAILVISGYLYLGQGTNTNAANEPIQLDCQTVKLHLVSFTNGKIEDGTTALGIAWHLRQCPCCKKEYVKLRCSSSCAKQRDVILKPRCDIHELNGKPPLP